MSEHAQEDQDLNAVKPVSFTVPFILALVTLFITVLFLSLCDPSPHHKSEGHGGVSTVNQPPASDGHEQKGAARTLTASGTESASSAGGDAHNTH